MKRDIPLSTLIVVIVGAVIFGVLSVLLGTVTHTGGIDGGIAGLVLSLATLVLGAATFYLLGGYLGWAAFAATVIVSLVLLLQIASGGNDLLITGTGASTAWTIGGPASLFVGLAVGIIITRLVSKRRSHLSQSDSVGYRGDEAFKGDR